ncbi:MAG TPA: hypothetical protein VMK12_13555, partial [Anaeromyxobacteraceae bacterium]|nr:hypothetical protein [Anaeromyxobacteraceae bacterium]
PFETSRTTWSQSPLSPGRELDVELRLTHRKAVLAQLGAADPRCHVARHVGPELCIGTGREARGLAERGSGDGVHVTEPATHDVGGDA